MSRIRTLKPEWLEDEALLECSLAARVLSAGLLLLADDYGNGRAGEKILSARIFPGDPVRVLRDALAELVAIRYVVIYQADGQTYFHVRNWAKHQKVDKPGTPKVPAPPRESSPETRESPEKVSEEPEKDSEGLAPRARPLPSPPDPLPDPIPSEGEARGRVRQACERPIPRPDMLRARVTVHDWVPLSEHREYAEELGLGKAEFEKALRDLRDKIGPKPHDLPWLDDKFSSFIEAAAKPRHARAGSATSRAQSQLDEQMAHVAELEAREAAGT